MKLKVYTFFFGLRNSATKVEARANRDPTAQGFLIRSTTKVPSKGFGVSGLGLRA